MRSPIDVAVAAVLAKHPGLKFEAIAQLLGISASKAHGAVRHLSEVGLVLPEGRRVNRLAFLEFLEHGLQYAFPAKLGKVRRGVPTAHSGPVLDHQFDEAGDGYVWPSPDGIARGRAIEPLLPKACELPQRAPHTYEMLSLIDALRVGRARERAVALDELRKRLGIKTTALAL
jgi:DNA-binding Lrp family transcriptional regulator